jgi:hypothetical protein
VSPEEQQGVAEEFLRHWLAGGFGSMTKRETELLVFHLLRQRGEYRGLSAYELAATLRIPERRIRTLRLESALKYEDINSKAVLGCIVQRLVAQDVLATFEGGKVSVALEDPVEQRELEHFLKSRGHHAEYTLNTELLRIAPVRLLELMLDNMERGEREFEKLVRRHVDDKAASARLLDKALTLRQKFDRLREETLNSQTLVALMGDAAKVFAGG